MKGESRVKKGLQVFGAFIKQHRYSVCAYLICAGIIHAVLYLYKINLEIIVYADVICLLVVLVAGSLAYLSFYRKRRQLLSVVQQETLLTEELPQPDTEIEQAYYQILMKLQERYACDMQGWNLERKNSLEFYTTWIHQIKVPIATMKLVLQGEDTEENRELLAELFQIEQYVAMVLNYYRLEGTETDFVFREISADDAIRQVIHKYAGQFVRKRLRLEYKESGQRILTDEKWFVFLLEQVVSNAIKYTKTGAVTIRAEGDGVFAITDTGIGIAPEDLPRIFEKGFTGYNGRLDKKATGIGLYLCRKTADKLGIRVDVESTVGVGTTVRIYVGKERLLTD